MAHETNRKANRIHAFECLQLHERNTTAFALFQMGLSLRNGSPIINGSKWEGEGRHELSIEEIRKIFWKTRDLKTKTLVSMATDLGFRVGSFLELTPSVFGNLEQATSPLEFKFETQKEHVKAHTCLNKTSIELLKEFVKVYKIQPQQKLFTEPEETVNRTLRELATQCGIDTKNLSFHCFRDLVIRTAQNLGIDIYLYKRMVGKTISRDMRGYSSKDVKEAFEKLQTKIAINCQILASEHQDLLTQLGQQVLGLNNKLEQQTKDSKGMFASLLKVLIFPKASEIATINVSEYLNLCEKLNLLPNEELERRRKEYTDNNT